MELRRYGRGPIRKHICSTVSRKRRWSAKGIIVLGVGFGIISAFNMPLEAGEPQLNNTEFITTPLNIASILTIPGIDERGISERSLCSREPLGVKLPTLSSVQYDGEYAHPYLLTKYLRFSFSTGDTGQQPLKNDSKYIAGDKNGGILDKWWVAGIAVTGAILVKYVVFKHGYSKPIPEFPAHPQEVR